MKTANDILTHIKSLPKFKYLKTQDCYKKYISFVGLKYRKAIAFVYIKKDTLFIAIKHPIFKQELNYNQDLLKSILKDTLKYTEECQGLKASKIVIFHTKFKPKKEIPQIPSTLPPYKEKAYGSFKLPEDKELKKIYEKIQNAIECNR